MIYLVEIIMKNFPVTAIRDTKPGNIIQNDGSIDERRDEPGVFRDLGYVTINNFYELPEYEDEKQDSFQKFTILSTTLV